MIVIIASIALTALFLWITSKIVAVLSSPLNAIPNAHITAPFSRLWLLWIRARGVEFSTHLAAHRRLGPVIRIGPREISIDCIKDGVRTVYGGNWDKSSLYDNFTQFGFSPLFAIRQAKPHSERKRVFTHIYLKSTIMNSPELAVLLTTIGQDRLLPRLQRATKEGKDVDVYSLTREYSMDVVTTYVYGMKNGTNWVEYPNQASHYLSAFQHAVEPWAFFASTEIQRLVSIFGWFGINLLSPSVNRAFDTIHSFVLDLTVRTIGTLENNHSSENGSMNTFRDVWQRLENVPEEQKTHLLASDMVDQIHAGHEATGIVLTYLMWELSRNTEVQDRLRNELRSLSEPRSSELLDAVLMETIRLYPAGFGPFPRVAPDNAKVKGFDIPKGTIATASPYTLGRNTKIFPRAESWIPERWLDADDAEKRQMRQWVWMFMSGARNCIGEHLAVLAMKAFVVDIYSNYRTIITGNPNMSQLETFFSIPANGSLNLKFEVVSKRQI
ncbi:33155921-59ed-4708-986e-86a03f7298ff [Sclerotinia trifoliorum]|uniref:33155921-59ed-4708-986e-86a03f7298ff n=1 Tax=Sclerotinia trifoliorum TaxID=28548 RepID=A0A8H2VWT7_9HELO|nr:33155921-59ed-4708-986e-86a03f7298ff [Sclerotinia trifoliorum]